MRVGAVLLITSISFMTPMLGSQDSLGQRPSGIHVSPVLTHTAGNVRYGHLGGGSDAPSPTLFVFAGSLEDSLTHPIYSRCCSLLMQHGFRCVSLDLPAHGRDVRPGEPKGLKGWSHRVRQGDDPMADFTNRAREVLDALVEEGLADPRRVLASGTSRGGFAALHLAAADSRVGSAAALAPVTDLAALREFQGLEGDPLTRSLALVEKAEALAARDLWIIIGDRDERVSTQRAIELALAVSRAAVSRKTGSRLEFRVEFADGHRVPEGAYRRASHWLLRQASQAEKETVNER